MQIQIQPAVSANKRRGAASPPGTVSFEDMTVADIRTQPTDANARFQLNADGTFTFTGNSVPGATTWGTGVTGADYEVRFTETSGSVVGSSSATATWLTLGSPQVWIRTRTLNITGSTTCIGTLEVREASTGIVRDTATITMTATT